MTGVTHVDVQRGDGLRAGKREWLGLAVLSLPTLMVSLDLGVLFLALPILGAELHASSTQLLWISDVYGFVVAGLLVTMGPVGDRIGRRRLLLIGAAGFALASVMAAFADSAAMLIFARALLGVAGATLMPSTLALISTMFRHPGQRATAIGLWGACVMFGVAAGPIAGGFLLTAYWWGSVFLLGVPVMGLLLLTGPFLLPEHRDPAAGRVDLPSVALSLATMLPAVYGLKEVAANGPTQVALLASVVALGCGVAFVQRQRRLREPLLDMRLFADRTLTTALGVLALGATASGGAAFLFIQHLQLVAGLAPMQASLWMLPHVLAMTVGSLVAPALASRLGTATVLAAGLAAACGLPRLAGAGRQVANAASSGGRSIQVEVRVVRRSTRKTACPVRLRVWPPRGRRTMARVPVGAGTLASRLCCGVSSGLGAHGPGARFHRGSARMP